VILIADGDAEARKTYCALFPATEFQFEEASDGAEALGKALCRRPAAIIADAALSRISGVDLCMVLRRDPLTRSVPIIIVTPDAGDGGRNGREAGADAVIPKMCPDQVAAEVRRVLAVGRENPGSPEPMPAPAHSGPAEPRLRSRAFERQRTTAPVTPPPALLCPSCDVPLVYQCSYIGGVSASASEQWDRYNCPHCGSFEYRHRTRKLRPVA
jgi:CheY-like chemotaxis protein